MFTLLDMALPYQRRFILAPERRRVWCSARQVGKSWALAYLAAWEALRRPGGLSLCVSTGQRAASELLKKCVQMAEAARELSGGRITYAASADKVEFSTGGRVLSLPSGNPSALRGYTASAVLVDEAAYVENMEEVMQALAPTLTRDPSALLVLASTPAGKSGPFWEAWSGSGDGWLRMRTTVHDAAADGLDVDVGGLRELVGDPDVFAVEYECAFADKFSSMLDLSLLRWYDSPPEGAKAAYLGMDVGATGDRTAFATVYVQGDRYWADDVAVMSKAAYEDQLRVLGELHARERYASGYVDANGIGGPVAEWANKKVSALIRGYQWTAQNKTPAYENLRSLVFDRRIEFRSSLRPLLEEDFANVRRIVSESGKVSFEAGRGRGGHSDATSALVLALEAARDRPASFGEPQAYARFSPLGGRFSRL